MSDKRETKIKFYREIDLDGPSSPRELQRALRDILKSAEDMNITVTSENIVVEEADGRYLGAGYKRDIILSVTGSRPGYAITRPIEKVEQESDKQFYYSVIQESILILEGPYRHGSAGGKIGLLVWSEALEEKSLRLLKAPGRVVPYPDFHNLFDFTRSLAEGAVYKDYYNGNEENKEREISMHFSRQSLSVGKTIDEVSQRLWEELKFPGDWSDSEEREC